MKIDGIHHVSLNVGDVEAARQFYVDILGFAVMPSRPNFDFDGAWLHAGNNQVHLIGGAVNPPDRRQHFALQVDSLQEWMDHLTDLDVPFRHSPHIIGAGDQIFLNDPWGNRIELNQPDVHYH
jgi:glyoxylase I family protein